MTEKKGKESRKIKRNDLQKYSLLSNLNLKIFGEFWFFGSVVNLGSDMDLVHYYISTWREEFQE